mmetsp:Transcript_30336/g.97645  ORF Transcript_30336/g.97645 Transcript_30336/m.97645 type:complete len:876 (-) Transcript_30336:895-3522(-)
MAQPHASKRALVSADVALQVKAEETKDELVRRDLLNINDNVPVLKRRAEYVTDKYGDILEQHADPANKLYISMFEGHLDAVSCMWVAEVDGEEVLITGSYDAIVRMFSTATKRCIRMMEGHHDLISAVCTHVVEAAKSFRKCSGVAIVSKNCVWNERLEFQTEGRDTLITVTLYEQSVVDGHEDEIGAVYLPFADLFEIKANYDLVVTKTFTMMKDGSHVCNLSLEITWHHTSKRLEFFLINATSLKQKRNSKLHVAIDLHIIPRLRLFSASHDYRAIMWNIETGTAITVYKGHRDSVTSMKILDAHGTQQLFTASLDATVRIWDVISADCFRVLSFDSGVNSMDFILQTSMSFDDSKLAAEKHSDDPEHYQGTRTQIFLRVKYEKIATRDVSRLQVEIERAKNLPDPTKPNKSKTYFCRLLFQTDKFQTASVSRERPVWEASYTLDLKRLLGDEHVIVLLYEWDDKAGESLLGKVSFSVDVMMKAKAVEGYFVVNTMAVTKNFLAAGCSNGAIKIIDLQLGEAAQQLLGHSGCVTSVNVFTGLKVPVLFTTSMDGTMKIWRGKVEDDVDLSEPLKSWDHQIPVNSCCACKYQGKILVFRGCQNGNVYMNSIPLHSMSVAISGWKVALARLLDSVSFSVTMLLLILGDLAVGLSLSPDINPDPSLNDCLGRDSPIAGIITLFVLSAFVFEFLGQTVIKREWMFVPVEVWTYFDILVVVVSVGVALYKFQFDYSLSATDPTTDTFVPPIVSSPNATICEQSIGKNTGVKNTQKAITAFRSARMVGRIATGIRIVRAIVRGAQIARRLGSEQGKVYRGHKHLVTSVIVVPPCEKREQDTAEKDSRLWFQRKWRLFSASGDRTVIMWDIVGRDIEEMQ